MVNDQNRQYHQADNQSEFPPGNLRAAGRDHSVLSSGLGLTPTSQDVKVLRFPKNGELSKSFKNSLIPGKFLPLFYYELLDKPDGPPLVRKLSTANKQLTNK